MQENWKDFTIEFFNKNPNRLKELNLNSLDNHDIFEVLPESSLKTLKLFCFLSSQNLKWFQENWREWQNDVPDEKITSITGEKIPLKIDTIVGDDNEKIRWLFDCTFSLSDKSRNYLLTKLPLEKGVRFNMKEKVFIIHGHDGGATGLRTELKLLLKEAQIEYIILEEEASRGMETIVEKLIRVSASCTYAIALFTKDDFIQDDKYRARQNVLLEVGYFMGKIGREKVSLINVGAEIPSDLGGVLYVRPTMNLSQADWKRQLLKTLEDVGFSIPSVTWRNS